MATSYSIDVLDNMVREELPAVITETLPTIAPVYKYIKKTSLGVTRDGIGRDWKTIHLFGGGVAGLMQHSDPRGPMYYDNAYYPQTRVLNGTNAAPFPSASAAPHVGTLKRELPLHMSTGNFSIPVTWIQGDKLSASQIEQVSRDIKGVGELRAQTEAASFFMPANNTLCQIDNYDSTGESVGYIQFTVKAGTGRTAFFRRGMMVDVVLNNSGPQFGEETDGTDRVNYVTSTEAYIPLIVADVDYFSGVIKVASAQGEHLQAADLASGTAVVDDDYVVLRENVTASREMRTWGLEDWIKAGTSATAAENYIMGGSSGSEGLDLATYSEFRSLVKAVNGPLTDTVMNGYIGGFLDAYPGASLDTIITTMGVTLKYIEQPSLYNNRMFYDRQGKSLDVKGGWDDVAFSFNGRTFNWLISPLCISGYLYATKFGGGNVKRYMPPKVGGTNALVGDEVEFLAPVAGHSTVFMVGRGTSGEPQALLEAPFWQYCLIAPTDVKSVKLTGLTEATMS